MQLDGWWYPKGASDIWSNHNAGIYTYNADPTLFPNGLLAFQQQLGIPLMTQAKYIDASSLYNNLTTIRVSGDRFSSANWNTFLYASELASALGIWPWSDVFMSTETDNLLLSTLSAGIVGVGDPIGVESATNLLQTIRADGGIVKPDEPIVPIDSMYIQDAQATIGWLVACASWMYSPMREERIHQQ